MAEVLTVPAGAIAVTWHGPRWWLWSDALTEAADCWQRDYGAWQLALEHRRRVISRAERRVVRATGGLGRRKWETACRRRRINTRAEASIRARAVRARPEVRATVSRRLTDAEQQRTRGSRRPG
jgi:hypothetical protein